MTPRRWGSNPRPFGLESSTLPLSHCAPIITITSGPTFCQARPYILSGLIRAQTVCKGYQHTILADKEFICQILSFLYHFHVYAWGLHPGCCFCIDIGLFKNVLHCQFLEIILINLHFLLISHLPKTLIITLFTHLPHVLYLEHCIIFYK